MTELQALLTHSVAPLSRLLSSALNSLKARTVALATPGEVLSHAGEPLREEFRRQPAGVSSVEGLVIAVVELSAGQSARMVVVSANVPAPELLASWAAGLDALVSSRQELTIERGEGARLRRQLERADRLATVGSLAAGIAHELGTPLAVIAGRARQLASLPPDQLAPTARTIADQADRMTAIIRQLLGFARRREPKFGRFDLRLLVRQSLGLMSQEAERRKVTISFDDPPEPVALRFDGSQLMQVMTNLLMNALQATSAGGQVAVTLGVAEVVPPADTGLARGRYAQLSVRDTGAGIQPDNVRRIFEPFFTTKDTGEGTGLGLSVTQGIVRDHEGWVAVESTLGKGTTFTVHLPEH